MPKFPYRKAGAAWDRVFRNDHNQNLDDIADDIRGSYTELASHKNAKPPTRRIKSTMAVFLCAHISTACITVSEI